MDSTVEPAMIVHKRDGGTMKFKEHADGLYYFDTQVNTPNVLEIVNLRYLNVLTINPENPKYPWIFCFISTMHTM
jgi:hypothetical protein